MPRARKRVCSVTGIKTNETNFYANQNARKSSRQST